MSVISLKHFTLLYQFQLIPNAQLMTRSPAENTPGEVEFLREKFDGQNGHRPKLLSKLAPHYMPPHLSKKMISIFFSLNIIQKVE